MLELALVLALFGTPELPKLEAHNLGISTVFLQPEPTVSATHFAFAVSEAHEGGTDLNSDGDLSDEVLHLLDLRTGSIANLGIVLSPFGGPVQLHLTGKFLVYRSQVEPFGIYRRDLVSGKTELLSDKHLSIYVDEDGWMILRTSAMFAPFQVYSPDGRLVDTLRLGSAVTGFNDGLAALIPWEGNYRDFNGDLDATDEVAMFYDARKGRLFNSGLAVNHKQSGISADYPPRVSDNWIQLLVSELAQGNADLIVNGTFPTENHSEHVRVVYSRATGEAYQLNDAYSNFTADMGRYLVYAASPDGQGPDLPVRVLDSQKSSIIDLGVKVDFNSVSIVQGSDDGCLLLTDEGPRVLRASDLSLESIPEVTVLSDFILGVAPAPDRTALMGTTPETSEDLNGDGDTEDTVIYRYDYANESGGAMPIAAGWSFAPSNGVWPFVSNEAKQGTDWNEDGDLEDFVWILVEESTGAAYNTGLDVGSVYGGTYEFVAYSNGTALFRGHEPVSGIDWNGDGDTEDNVLFEAVLPAR